MSKKILGIALAALMLLIVALPASAVQATSVEIRGDVVTNAATGAANVSWNATNFAAFWYDLKDDLKTENLQITNFNALRTIEQNSLWYNTTEAPKTLKVIQNGKANSTDTDFTKFETGGKYNVVGWQAQPYVAVKGKAKKLAKLVIEQGNATSEKKSLTIGETWDIGDGWTLTAQSIDAKATPRQAWLVLSKDGVKKDDKVIETGKAYAYIEKNFAGESDVPLFVTYVDSVFAGATSDMVQLRYTWAISTSVTEIKTADKFGNMEVQTADDDNIKLYNKDRTISLSKDTTADIFGDLKFKVADSDTVRFYPMVVRTTPGKYEVRGTVVTNAATGAANVSWNATNFAAFWYDLKDDLKTENLQITNFNALRTIEQNSLWYNTTEAPKTLKVIQNGKANSTDTDFTKFETGGKYNVVGWQAQPYVAVKGKAKKLAKLVIEQGNATSEKKSLTIGETWDIGDGWTLTAQSIDAKATPRQAWLVLSKDGVKKDDKVIETGKAYAYIEKNFAGESDVPLFVTYVDSVFAGATSDMVQLRYTWAISTSVTEIKTADKFGNMEVQTADDDNIKLYNKDRTISLSKDTTADIFGELKFKVADSDTVRFYPMVEYQIGVGPTTTGPTTTGTVTGTGTPTKTGTATGTGTPIVTGTAAVTETAKPKATATPKEPGFEAGLAIAGLLAVAFLVLRQRK